MSQICIVSIYVPDLKAAIDFYTNTLGFELQKQYGPNIASLVNDELPLILEESPNTTANEEPNSSRVVLALKTEDIYDTVIRLKDGGVRFVIDEPTNCPPGKYISFNDPFGNTLEYIQFENA